MQMLIEDRWRKYRGKQSFLSRTKAGINCLRKILLLILVKNYRKREWRIREIERAVSLKHQDAWKQFQQSDAKSLLVLESDAAWIEMMSDGVPDLLEVLTDTSPVYLNLAGGLKLAELGVDLLLEKNENASGIARKNFSKPITNTSCAYAVNRTLVNFFLSYTEKFPDQKSLGIDWLINGVFMDMARQDLNVNCVHSYPPILSHGSMTGISSSWHPGRS